jgi:hypothetical protein
MTADVAAQAQTGARGRKVRTNPGAERDQLTERARRLLASHGASLALVASIWDYDRLVGAAGWLSDTSLSVTINRIEAALKKYDDETRPRRDWLEALRQELMGHWGRLKSRVSNTERDILRVPLPELARIQHLEVLEHTMKVVLGRVAPALVSPPPVVSAVVARNPQGKREHLDSRAA